MSDDFLSAIRVVGLSHMIVVSGYHLGIVVGQSKRLFRKISRAAIIVSATLTIMLFVSIAGLSASMMRASFMSLATLFAWYFGRKIHPGRIIIYTAAISLLLSPNLTANIAWQLSFASYAGIAFFAPVLTRYLYGKRKSNFFSSSIITSISAQISCLPLSIYHFGSFSIIGVFATLIIAPTVPAVMLLTFVGVFIPPISTITKLLINIHLSVISILSQNSWAIIDLEVNNPAYLLLFLPVAAVFTLLKHYTHYDFRPRYTLEKSREYGKIYSC